jgi:hypothetical protein
MQRKHFFLIVGIVFGILLIPFIAMQVTEEVNWSAFDFIIMGGMLLSKGVLIEVLIRKIRNKTNRFVLLGLSLLVFFLLWAEIAVGIFGSPISGS